MIRRTWLVAVVLSSSCLELTLPPPPGPGTIQGTLVVAVTGQPGFQPAPRGRATVSGSALEATADTEGRFTLLGLTASTGKLLLASDADGDGRPERQRFFSLEAIGARMGRDVSLGQVVLSRNGAVRGRVTRAGVDGPGGLGGTTVFVPGAPWNTRTGDDGTFVLGELPQGAFQLAFFAEGFTPASVDVELGPAEEKTLPAVRLEPGATSPASVKGQLKVLGGAPAGDAQARLRGTSGERMLPVDAEGRFAATGLRAGLFSFAFEHPGAIGVSFINVLLPPGETDFGVIALADGTGRPISLFDTPPFDGGLGAGGGSAGGSTAGGSAGGSTAGGSAGGSTAGGSAGGSTAGGSAGGSTAGGSAGGSTAGGSAGGSTAGGSAGGSTAGGSAGGSTAGGSAGGSTAGGSAVDAGVVPIAVATGPAFVAANSLVTVSGSNSTGAFPLLYRWTQRTGPPVTLSTNNSFLSQTTFTAPAIGNVVELELVVVDQLGVSSAPSSVRVGVGGPPVARFTPDGGLIAGGQLVSLTSTSFDDAGLPIVAFDWQLATGTGGVLTIDGGLATWRAPAVAFGSPDLLGSVSLSVTNSIGVRSAPSSQFWTVRGANPDNWSLDAGVLSPIAVGRTPPTVVLRSAVTTSIPSPQYTLAWSCTPSMPLIGANGASPQFLAPAVVGPNVPVSCVVQATGQAPLDPPVLSATAALILNDAADPQLVSSSVDLARASTFGFRVTGDELLSGAGRNGGCTFALGVVVGKSVLFGYRDTPTEFTACSPIDVTLTDRATPANTSVALRVGSNNNTVVQTVWAGPFESSSAFDDPRPIVAALGVLPEARQELFGVNPSTTPGFELVGTQGGRLVRFAGLDLAATQATCAPTCSLTSTPSLSGLTAEASPRGTRVSWSGAELLVATSSDGGFGTTYARRSPSGTWSTFPGVAGVPNAWNDTLRSVRLSGGELLVDTLSTDLQSVLATEPAATGLGTVSLAASQQNRVFAATGPTKQLLIRERNPLTLVWTTRPSTFTNVTSILPIPHFGGVQFVAVEEGVGGALSLQRIDGPGGNSVFTIGPVQGYDVVTFGETTFLVFSAGGDVRFQWLRYGPLGGGSGFTDFGGPPRVGFTAPYPVMLDATPSCEAAWPRLTIVNEALVITWQERCPPATQWKVMARVVR
ncbi:MAG: hypothetical protein Q8L14_09555 [Myxococcales bacterium]|nr:hypothetical protein [Myxococcales bacterium]